ncbi:MAG: hypothetical protein AAF090_18495 [Bacteroidota bacterium]
MKKVMYLALALAVVSCTQEEFNIGNPNQADAARVLANAADFQNFNISNHTNNFFSQIGFNGVYFRASADQFSTTNAFRGFWDYCDQPRRQIENTTANSNLIYQAAGPWGQFNSVINNANIVINNIENDGNAVILNGVDLTDQELAGAYFDKGIAQGYLSMIYDRAYIVDPDTDPNALEFATYQEMLGAAIGNLQTAISLANGAGAFEYTLYPTGPSVDAGTFVQLANSYMARLTIANPRTNAEAQGIDYNQILTYANNGIVDDYSPPASENIIWNNLHTWSLFLLGDGAGYMPTDQKILHLFDPTYPTDYPTDTTILGEITTDDPRAAEYYEYVGENFGFLRESRGRQLFSSYRTQKFFNGGNQNVNGAPLEIFSVAELDYIKAECYYRLGNLSAAVAALDASPRMTVGMQSTTEAAPNILNALLYEISIELDLQSGMGVPWAFMRRHDMLQAGSMTMYPVPASELEITQDAIYTFGGPAQAGEVGTASGANDWRNIDLVY